MNTAALAAITANSPGANSNDGSSSWPALSWIHQPISDTVAVVGLWTSTHSYSLSVPPSAAS